MKNLIRFRQPKVNDLRSVTPFHNSTIRCEIESTKHFDWTISIIIRGYVSRIGLNIGDIKLITLYIWRHYGTLPGTASRHSFVLIEGPASCFLKDIFNQCLKGWNACTTTNHFDGINIIRTPFCIETKTN